MQDGLAPWPRRELRDRESRAGCDSGGRRREEKRTEIGWCKEFSPAQEMTDC